MPWSRRVPGASAAGTRGRAGQEEWQRALAAAARRLEAAWLALLAGARAEQDRWKAEIDRVRGVAPAYPAAVAHHRGSAGGGYLSGTGAGRVLARAVRAAPVGGALVVWSVTVIGVGIDLVDLERVRSLLTRKGEQAMTRFFSDREREYLATRPDAYRPCRSPHCGQGGGL